MRSNQLLALLREARSRQLSLFLPLEGYELIGQQEHHQEPPIWEMGHVAWFQEMYILRGLDRRPPIVARYDGIYDSFNVSYRRRWSHDFPSKEETLAYAQRVLDECTERLNGREPGEEEEYIYRLIVDHESMHSENLASIWRNLGYGEYRPAKHGYEIDQSYRPHDVDVEGGIFPLGASRDQGYVLDNEKWERTVEVAPFRISSTPVTNREFIEFLDSGAYANRSLWDKDGWNWRRRSEIEGPLYWRQVDGVWQEHHYNAWRPIEPWHPVCHVNLHEARAYCRFAQRRLPTEAEWEMAASWDPVTRTKSIYPWGDSSPTAQLVHMSLESTGTIDVRAKAPGDSPVGCRQMIGNVWEWTSSKFEPYPGFEVGAYEDYSVPYFGKKPVLRGGCWATSPSLIRNTWRNFFIKHRRNIFAGIRTCAL